MYSDQSDLRIFDVFMGEARFHRNPFNRGDLIIEGITYNEIYYVSVFIKEPRPVGVGLQ
jgi:hypothetical protein